MLQGGVVCFATGNLFHDLDVAVLVRRGQVRSATKRQPRFNPLLAALGIQLSRKLLCLVHNLGIRRRRRGFDLRGNLVQRRNPPRGLGEPTSNDPVGPALFVEELDKVFFATAAFVVDGLSGTGGEEFDGRVSLDFVFFADRGGCGGIEVGNDAVGFASKVLGNFFVDGSQ